MFEEEAEPESQACGATSLRASFAFGGHGCTWRRRDWFPPDRFFPPIVSLEILYLTCSSELSWSWVAYKGNKIGK